ncbi:MAG TPA: alkaline phosphatase family protein, partial [Planctomycetota bacterium]|nr:alkaline phosphatase family protein [Planctomycetota bacterium]
KGTESNLLNPAAPASSNNPSFAVNSQAPFAVLVGQGPGHSIDATNLQLSGNKTGPTAQSPAMNKGFVLSYDHELIFGDKVPSPTPAQLEVVMQSFAPSALPSLNALADAFLVCDAWHAEVPGPTQPNRLYMHAATSFGYAHNVWTQIFKGPTIYDHLQAAGCTWATYDFDSNEVREFSSVNQQSANFKKFADAFKVDVAAGTLANYSFIVPRFLNQGTNLANSQHAPQDARYGDNLVADVYEALVSNPAVWSKTALIVTYDEHGGFYDHVIPPSAGIPNPDGLNSPPAGDKASFAPPFAFDRLGIRVPTVIASPYTKAGTVDSTRYQHTSILATVKKLFGLPSFLTKRDASAATFEAHLSELGAPRTDTPSKLPRAALPAITASLDDPAHPANHPLDTIQKEELLRAYWLTQDAHPNGPSIDDLPNTQSAASDFIQKRYAKKFGPPGKPGKLPPLPRSAAAPRVKLPKAPAKKARKPSRSGSR